MCKNPLSSELSAQQQQSPEAAILFYSARHLRTVMSWKRAKTHTVFLNELIQPGYTWKQAGNKLERH